MKKKTLGRLSTSVGKSQSFRLALRAVAASVVFSVSPVGANGLTENQSWQFQTSQDRVNKGAVLDLIERKKGGYYDAIKTNINNTTYIDRQYNCSVTALATGNSGSNATTASTSSPNVTSSGATTADTAANSASNGLAQSSPFGVLQSGVLVPAGSNGINSNQSNSGSLSSGVTGSTTSSSNGAVTSGSGVSDQVLNSQQSNTGTLTSSIQGSTACIGPLNAN